MPERNYPTRRQILERSALAAGAGLLLSPQSRAADAAEAAPFMKFFPASFRNERIKTSGAEINAVIGGSLGTAGIDVSRRAGLPSSAGA